MQKQKIRRRNRQPSPLVAQHYETSSKQSRLQRLRDFINRHRIAIMCICGVILIAIGGAVAFVLTYRAPVADTAYHTPAKKAPKPAEKYANSLTSTPHALAAIKWPVSCGNIKNSVRKSLFRNVMSIQISNVVVFSKAFYFSISLIYSTWYCSSD